MINQENIEKLYDIIDESCTILYDNLQMPYIEGLFASCANIMAKDVLQKLDDDVIVYLEELYSFIYHHKFSCEEIRKTMQYLFLNALKETGYPNTITPDTISYLMENIARRLFAHKALVIFDPLIGSGNLALSILNNYQNATIIGVDNNELMIRMAELNANMQQHIIKLYFQDTFLSKIFDVDLLVSDIPHGMITQFINYHMDSLKDGGFMILLGDKEEVLKTDKQNMIGIIELPASFFRLRPKSLFLIQKGEKKYRKFLIAIMPELENKNETKTFINNLNQWFNQEEKND